VKKGQEVLLPKDREQIECLINRYKETADNLVDLRTQIWSKLDIDDDNRHLLRLD
jgi:hypothetical protein